MYDTILFDLDGTLSDSAEGIINCVSYALESMGIDAPRSELYCFVGPPLADMFMEKFGMDAETANAATNKYRERYSSLGILENTMYPGISEMLRSLRGAGKRLAVATSKPTKFSRTIVERYGIADCFELVLGSEFDGTRGTKAEVIDDVCRGLGLSEAEKRRAVMVGDRSYDVLGARQCGLDCIGVCYGYGEPGELTASGAVRLVQTVPELGRALLEK